MRFLSFPAGCRLEYEFTGKFVAPDKNWKHELFDLHNFELIVMTEGTLYLSYGEDRFTVKKGEFLLLPPSKAFRSGFKESYCSFYWLHFTASDFTVTDSPSAALRDNQDSNNQIMLPQSGTVPKLEKMVVLMKQLQDEVKNKYPLVCINAMTTSVITELYGQLFLHDLLPSGKTSGREQIYSDILDYIQLNLSRNIRASDVAAHFGYNEKYFSHMFSSFSGMPLKQFILAQKIDKANFLLNDTNMSIVEISREVGFSDSHSFSRCYKRATGISPTKYRNAFSKRILFDK